MWQNNTNLLGWSGRIWAGVAAALAVMAVVGFAIAGSLGVVNVQSSPSGAQVIVNGQVVGATPVKLELPANQEVRIKLTKDGYKAKSFNVTPSADKSKRVQVTLTKE
jgi:hypothetical protein